VGAGEPRPYGTFGGRIAGTHTYMIHILRETKRTPSEIQERVTRAGGRNRFGEPNFRVVWGWSRLEMVGGKWCDRDTHGSLIREVVELREVPKYFPHERWHLERWMPPEAYGSPEEWYRETIERADGRSVPALGPFPSRGEWEHCFTIQTPGGEFLGLTPEICDYVVRAIEWSRAQPRAKKREAVYEAEERKRAEYDRFVDDVLWNEPRFHAQPYVVVA
jgi:hypothetical protein